MTRDLRRVAIELLERYVRTGSRADAFVAADVVRELGHEDLGADVQFSGEHCRKGRRVLLELIAAVIYGGEVVFRGELPALRAHYREGYAPPERVVVAVRYAGSINVTVWERVGFLDPRGRFECEWRLWGYYDRSGFRLDEDLRETMLLELDLEDRGLSHADKWLRLFVSPNELRRWMSLLQQRLGTTTHGSREHNRALAWYHRLGEEGMRRIAERVRPRRAFASMASSSGTGTPC